ncbi:MAG: YdbL family protein [Verrucomicrobiales bacterium]
MKKMILPVLAMILVGGFLAPPARAADEGALKARMSQRLSQIVALKQGGKLGEDARGFLSARSALSAKEKALMDAENADRRAVYALIAAKTNTSAAKVGAARAASIRGSAPAGTWVQLPNGKWQRK